MTYRVALLTANSNVGHTMRPITLLALLILTGVSTVATADLPDGYDYYPGSPLILGANFDPNHITVAKTPCLKYTVDSTPEGAVNTQLTEYLFTSSRGLRTALGIDASIDAQYLVFKGSASFSYNENSYNQVDSVSFVIRAYTEYGSRNLNSVEVDPDARKLLATPAQFVARCGSRYVKVERRGAIVAAIVTIENVESDFKRSFDAQVSASGGVGPISASFKSHLKTEMEIASKEGRLKVDIVATGGDGFGALKDVVAKTVVKPGNYDAIFAALGEYLGTFNKDNAAPIAFVVADIPGLNEAEADLWPTQKERRLEALVTAYRAYSSYSDQLRSIADNSDARSTLISSAKEASLAAAVPEFSSYLDRIAAAHRECKESTVVDLSVCALPLPRPDPGIIPPPITEPTGGFRILETSRSDWPGTYWPASQSNGVFSEPDADSTSLVVRAERITGSQIGPIGVGFAVTDPYFIDATIICHIDTISDSKGTPVKIDKDVGDLAHFERENFSTFATVGQHPQYLSLQGPNGLIPVIAFYFSDLTAKDSFHLLLNIPLIYPNVELQACARAAATQALKVGSRDGAGYWFVRLRNAVGDARSYTVGPFSWTLSDGPSPQKKHLKLKYSLPGISKITDNLMSVCDDSQILTVEDTCIPKVCPDGKEATFILGCLRPPTRVPHEVSGATNSEK